MQRAFFKYPLVPICLMAISVALISFAQEGKRPVETASEGKRPVTKDEGRATVSTRVVIKKVYVNAPAAPRRAAYNWVIIRPELEDAVVKIDDVPIAKSAEDDFRKELPVGKKYTVSVSAGSDYDTFTKSYIMSAKQPEIIPLDLKYKFGSVKIVTSENAFEGARISIDGKPQTVKLDKANSTILLDRVEPGARLITFDHPDYVLYERNAKIEANTEYTWNFAPERPLVDLEVQTDPDTTIYVDNEPKGNATSDGKFKRTDIKIGRHEVRLVKNGYEEIKRLEEFAFRKPVTIKETLIPKRSSAEFHEEFDVADNSRWAMPAGGAKIDARRLVVSNSPVLCYPLNTFYWDFTMQFNLKLSNNGGAAWAVRAKDPDNYYLFYLSGPQGKIPNKFLTYIVQHNTFDPMKPLDNLPIVISAKQGDEYTIKIEASNNLINHIIIPSAMNDLDKKNKLAGEEVQLGTFTDKNKTFLYGGFGFRSIGAESFFIDDLVVQAH
jgi:hypothetical protein